MEDRLNWNRATIRGMHLTVREIRGLLTRASADLVRTLVPVNTPQPAAGEARPVDPRRFVESMSPFVRMN